MSGCHNPQIENGMACQHGVSYSNPVCCAVCTKPEENTMDISEKVKANWKMMYKTTENLSKRISKLEVHHVRQVDENRKLSKRLDEVEESYSAPDCHLSLDILTLESKLEDEINSVTGQLEGLHEHIEKLYDMINSYDRKKQKAKDTVDKWEEYFVSNIEKKNRKPHKCPVCDFSGAIQLESAEEYNRFKDEMNKTADGRYFIWCKSCEGSGIVWG